MPAVTDLRGAELEAAELSEMEWDGVKAVVAAVVGGCGRIKLSRRFQK